MVRVDEGRGVGVKRAVAVAALDGYVREGMVVGLGSGTTSEEMVRCLGVRVRGGLSIFGVASSEATERLARLEGIPLLALEGCGEIDVTIDGADEVFLGDLSMIKGGGGCLLWEKLLAKASREVVAIVERRKCVDCLGRFPLPIEVVPFGYVQTMRMIEACYGERGIGVDSLRVREEGGEFFRTDSGNYIVDVEVSSYLQDWYFLEKELNGIPGVVDNGLFCGVADGVIVGEDDGEGGVSISVYSGSGEVLRESKRV